jgi:YgiT-type zinc finger domain-containing protein
MDNDEVAGFCCSSCGSANVSPNRMRSAFWHDDRLVVVEGIPTLLCEHCGEQFYDDATSIALDLLRGTGFPPPLARCAIEVPVFDFHDATALTDLP